MFESFLLMFLPFIAQDQPTFRSDIALVHVDAEVRSQSGEITDLHKESFRIVDGGGPRDIVYFAHEEQPLEMILLFDTSSSMRPAVARVAEAAHLALGELRQGDLVAVMAFDRSADVIVDFTGDLAVAEKSIGGQVLQRSFPCCTPIQAALATASRQFLKQPAGTRRRAIVIITDDQGTSEYPGALRELWQADAVVLGVIVHPDHAMARYPGSSAGYVYQGMRNIAVRTGGDSIATSDAADGLNQMLHRLRSRYSLYYALPRGARPGEERTIEIQLTREAAMQHPGAIVRARTGYLVPGEKQ